MSSYTTQLRNIIEHYSQDQEGLSLDERIEIGRKHLFDFDYPFFDAEYQKIFETNFIKFFYTREIGFETEGLFKLKLDTWLNIEMNYYNKLFRSELLRFNPLHNTEIKTVYNKKNDRKQEDEKRTRVEEEKERNQKDDRNTQVKTNTKGYSTGESESTASGETETNNFERQIESDTPQNRLELTTKDGAGVIEYASKIEEDTQKGKNQSSSQGNTKSTDNSNVDGTSDADDTFTSNIGDKGTLDSNDNLLSNINTIEDYVQNQTGKIGSQSFSQMLNEYRSTFLRIERQIFSEMQELFMGVY